MQATVSGQNVLVALTIDSSIIDPDDPETLRELVREAVNDAMAKLIAQRGERVTSITDGFNGMISGAASSLPRVTPVTATRRRLALSCRARVKKDNDHDVPDRLPPARPGSPTRSCPRIR